MTAFTADDHRHMARALQLAERGLFTTDPNPRVGCVLVKDGDVVGEGWHEYAGGPHAEVVALKAAGERARGATAYVTLEPCSHHGRTPPCADALVKAGVARVVAAMQDPNPRVAGEGFERLRTAGVEVAHGLMAVQAEALNPGFAKRMRSRRPFVRCKLAMSLDGRTAMRSGESLWITGEAARLDVQRLRARSSAIVTGIGTVLADDPSLSVRLAEPKRQPLRVILDPRLSLPETAKLLNDKGGPVLVVTAAEPDDAWERVQARGAEVMALPHGPDGLDLAALLDELAARDMNEVLVETGATLAGSWLAAGLLDELVIYMAPKLMGDGARGLFRLPGIEQMADAIPLAISDVRAVGSDWRITARVA